MQYPSRVTVGLVNFNNVDMVEVCLDSVLCQQGGPYRIIFVDNASTDGSRELVSKKYSEKVEIIWLEENRGPNPARNIILDKADSEYVLFLDADVVLEEDVILRLVQELDEHQDAGVASPKIMNYENRSEVQFIGTFIHYIGAAIHLHENRSDTFLVTSLGGACLLVRRSAAKLIDGWDEDLFFGWTDGDFVYRLILAGYKALLVASTKIYHPLKTRGFSKAFHQIRNRWYFMLKTYYWRTLLLILPMILVYELFLVSFLLIKRQPGSYFLANLSVLSRLPVILRKRNVVQRLRKVKDKEVLTTGSFTVREDVLGNPWLSKVISFFNKGIDTYWIAVRRAC